MKEPSQLTLPVLASASIVPVPPVRFTWLPDVEVGLDATTGVPAGVAYTGGYEDDNPYDYIDGEPLLFLKK